MELFEASGMELWRMGIESEQPVDSSDGRLMPLKLKCDSHELLSALKELGATPIAEECGSDTRSISHHVTFNHVCGSFVGWEVMRKDGRRENV